MRSSVFGIVTLFLNSNIDINVDNYTPVPKDPSYYAYVNKSFYSESILVEFYEPFAYSDLFPKCCQPGFIYDSDSRDCVEEKSLSDIYEDLNITANFIRYGLYTQDCYALIDRFVAKKNLQRQDGYRSLQINDTIYASGKFCLDKIVGDNETYVIRLCEGADYCFDSDINNSKDFCIYKCCPDTFSLKDGQCRQTPKMGLRIKNYKNLFENLDNYGYYVDNNMSCEASDWFDLRQLDITLSRNGSLFRNDESKEYKISEYCLDTRYNTKTDSYTDIVSLCIFDEFTYLKWNLVRVAVVLTCVSFIITIAVYVFVNRVRKLADKIIACFCAIDLIFYMLYALRIFDIEFGKFCTIFGYIYFFMMISRLSWLNVLSYEIWQTVGRTRAKIGETTDVLWKRFKYLTIYAITVPFICTLFFVLGDENILKLPYSIRPFINPSGCAIDTSLYGNYGHFVHLYLPISILIIINLVFYIKTIMHFLKIKRSLNKITGSKTNQNQKEVNQNRKNGFIILKLGLVMGITWIYYIYDYLTGLKYVKILYSQILADIIRFSNCLEGLYFLIIFVMKWKKIKEILYKLKIMKKEKHSSSFSTRTSSMSLSTDETINTLPMETLPK